MISYRFVPISSQKGVLFLRHPVFLESGVHPFLDELGHHYIIYGKISVTNVAPPPYRRRTLLHNRANIVTIRRSINMLNWHETLGQISCPDQQVKCINEILLNIFSKFIPNNHS